MASYAKREESAGDAKERRFSTGQFLQADSCQQQAQKGNGLSSLLFYGFAQITFFSGSLKHLMKRKDEGTRQAEHSFADRLNSSRGPKRREAYSSSCFSSHSTETSRALANITTSKSCTSRVCPSKRDMLVSPISMPRLCSFATKSFCLIPRSLRSQTTFAPTMLRLPTGAFLGFDISATSFPVQKVYWRCFLK